MKKRIRVEIHDKNHMDKIEAKIKRCKRFVHVFPVQPKISNDSKTIADILALLPDGDFKSDFPPIEEPDFSFFEESLFEEALKDGGGKNQEKPEVVAQRPKVEECTGDSGNDSSKGDSSDPR